MNNDYVSRKSYVANEAKKVGETLNEIECDCETSEKEYKSHEVEQCKMNKSVNEFEMGELLVFLCGETARPE